jgi:Family of unknown function (DUF5677)
MKSPQGKAQQGVLKGHFRQGRIYRPPLLAYPETTLSDWVRTDFPDLLWPAILVSLHGDQGAVGFGRVQTLVIEAIGEALLDEAGIEFDGCLTSLERIPKEYRPAVLSVFSSNPVAIGSLPPQVRVLTQIFEDLPGAWLLSAGPSGTDDLNREEGFDFLTSALVEVVSDRHKNALVKAAPFGWELQRRRLHLVGDTGAALVNYPAVPENRSQADAFILSSFLSTKTIRNEHHPAWEAEVLAWAHSFWRQNWHQLTCIPAELIEMEGDGLAIDEEAEAGEHVGDEKTFEIDEIAVKAMSQVEALFNDFIEHVLDRDLPLDPSDAAKHEVLCGLVSRSARAVMALIRSPHMWSGEQGSSVMRILAETRIVITWMDLQDPAIYKRYQNYGRGKAKLMRRHMESLIESLGDATSTDLRELAKRVKERAGGDLGEEFQDVSVETTFSGISMRQMAVEAGMLDVYNFIYQSASGVVHGEWWAIEDYAMQRCVNPLHLVHNIPSFEDEYPTEPQCPRLLVAQLEGISGQALAILAGPLTQ